MCGFFGMDSYFFIVHWSSKTRYENTINLRIMLYIPKWHQDSVIDTVKYMTNTPNQRHFLPIISPVVCAKAVPLYIQ